MKPANIVLGAFHALLIMGTPACLGLAIALYAAGDLRGAAKCFALGVLALAVLYLDAEPARNVVNLDERRRELNAIHQIGGRRG